jgi:hypothetical protein
MARTKQAERARPISAWELRKRDQDAQLAELASRMRGARTAQELEDLLVESFLVDQVHAAMPVPEGALHGPSLEGLRAVPASLVARLLPMEVRHTLVDYGAAGEPWGREGRGERRPRYRVLTSPDLGTIDYRDILGRIVRAAWPVREHVRVETDAEESPEVMAYFDPERLLRVAVWQMSSMETPDEDIEILPHVDERMAEDRRLRLRACAAAGCGLVGLYTDGPLEGSVWEALLRQRARWTGS